MLRSVEITWVRWPDEADRLSRLREQRIPRLLLVDGDAPAPVVADEFEDWVRVPAPEEDLRARIEGLSRRAEAAESRWPHIDDDGVVRFRGRQVVVPGVEGQLMALLVGSFGAVVSRAALTEAGWPHVRANVHAKRNALDVAVLRLRRRLEEIGLVISTVRSRGYLLEAAATPPASATA